MSESIQEIGHSNVSSAPKHLHQVAIEKNITDATCNKKFTNVRVLDATNHSIGIAY